MLICGFSIISSLMRSTKIVNSSAQIGTLTQYQEWAMIRAQRICVFLGALNMENIMMIIWKSVSLKIFGLNFIMPQYGYQNTKTHLPLKYN
ncbi:hypothetical protein LENED_009900 [Lentinula edodes]|uniref:Uncharacterized protein n=1 Tax=Lentinula edodes TaxID=5353 RepID=A0A1Q3EL24_LENED|nr:hypothetical protein LENED_009900 [Lentinula edodes]